MRTKHTFKNKYFLFIYVFTENKYSSIVYKQGQCLQVLYIGSKNGKLKNIFIRMQPKKCFQGRNKERGYDTGQKMNT
jgi:translation elongation factor P/translation initiation factor 5A